MTITEQVSQFDEAYRTRTPPWVIGEPQPAVLELERAGLITGAVLDVGCGSGEHTVHLAKLGYDVLGLDGSPAAVTLAVATAAGRGVTARFTVADALDLPAGRGYDTVLDSALFHVFGRPDQADERARYVRSLHRACRPGGTVHLLALSDTEPGFGPRIAASVIRDAFTDGWTVEALEPSVYRGVVTEEAGDDLGRPVGTTVDLAAWLARIVRR